MGRTFPENRRAANALQPGPIVASAIKPVWTFVDDLPLG